MRIARVAFRLFTAATAGLSALATQRAGAQTGVIHGAVVHGGTHARIPGARVTVVGTNLSAVTEADGSYRITGVPEGDRILEATLPGYQLGRSDCVRVPGVADGIAVPILPVGYVPPPPEPARTPTGAPSGTPIRLRPPTNPTKLPPLTVINGLRYPRDSGSVMMLSTEYLERIESLDVLMAPRAAQRYTTCTPIGGAIVFEIHLPGSSGKMVGEVVDAATGARLSEVMLGMDSLQPNATGRSGRFSWFTSRGELGVTVAKYGYYPYYLPCRLRVPVDDSVRVKVWLPANPAEPNSTGVKPGPRSWSAPRDPLFVVNDTVWAPGSAAPTIPAANIASLEMLTRTTAATKYGQCGAAGAVLITTRRPPS